MKKVAIFVLLASAALTIAQHAKTLGADIYDPKADGAVQIEKALTQAKKEKKNVLLQFGANWCIWCHRLHELCAKDKTLSAELKKNFVVVLVDVDKDHNAATNKKYGNPIQFGLPALAVLDASGKLLTIQDSGKLEEGDHHSPAKVLAFLKHWSPKR